MASKRIEFLEAAAIEYEAAIDWYFERSPVAAQKFATEVNRALDNVEQSPQRWPAYLLGTRRFFLRHFPFTVIYRELPSIIQIIAVAHGHRRPDYWKQRL
jgi:plasmid stabilization system protein ParE